ncbi:hydroxyacylglutathione hydrolase gloB [Acrasis kona]|uniref:Hydroxyacylglutathione hydrolase gloB n=1 Tax=Acrasis kona TaxID=1008807 RepID=A0AAW2ZKN8_9EUKA
MTTTPSHVAILKDHEVHVYSTASNQIEYKVHLPLPQNGNVFCGHRIITLNNSIVLATDYLGNHHFVNTSSGEVLASRPFVGDVIKLDDDTLVFVTLEIGNHVEGFNKWIFYQVTIDFDTYDIKTKQLSCISVRDYKTLVSHSYGGNGYLIHTYDEPPETRVTSIYTGQDVSTIREIVNSDSITFHKNTISHHENNHWIGNRNVVVTHDLLTGNMISKIYVQEKRDALFLCDDYVGIDKGNKTDVFDLRRGRLRFVVEGHPKGKFGDLILTRSRKGEMELWSLSTCEMITKFGFGDYGTFLPGSIKNI